MAQSHKAGFLPQLTAGGVAGVSEILIMYPLDVVKTRLQLQRGSRLAGVRYSGMIDCFKRIIKQEGFMKLYRGIAAPILMETPKRRVTFGTLLTDSSERYTNSLARATKFTANDAWSRFYLRTFSADRINQRLAILTGASAGATEAIIVVPFELVKVRMQDASQATKYTGAADCLVKIVRFEGPAALFQGMESTMWRHIVWNAGYFGSIFQIKALLPPGQSPQQSMFNDFIAGCIGGTIGTVLNTPLDVVKTRIQSMSRVNGSPLPWTWPAVAQIAHEEGVSALYKGLVPKIVRFCPGGGILLVVYSAVLDMFSKLQ